MTTQQRETIFALATNKLSKDEFLRQFGSSQDACDLIMRLLEESLQSKNASDVECALIVRFIFGFSKEHLNVLCGLSDVEWHLKHEDVISAIDELRDVRAIDYLYQAALKEHGYLEYDESRALAVKAIWALGNLADSRADERLRQLAKSDNPILKHAASKQIVAGKPVFIRMIEH